MSTNDPNTLLIENYFSFLEKLSSDDKLELISMLSESMKSTKKPKKKVPLSSLYGAWVSEKSADEIIAEIKTARNFNRNREEL